MRLVILALLLSAGSVATGQPNPPAPQSANPTTCNSALQSISPASSVCLDPQSIKISVLPPPLPNQGWTGRGTPQVKPAIPAQLLTRGQNPVQFLALNQIAPPTAPNRSPRGKAEPIPTTFPDAHFENIPTNWPGLKYLLIDQTPSASAASDSKHK